MQGITVTESQQGGGKHGSGCMRCVYMDAYEHTCHMAALPATFSLHSVDY